MAIPNYLSYINILPAQYGHFIISFDTLKDEWTPNELSSHCVQEEKRLKHEKREKTDSAHNSNISNYNKRKRIKERKIPVGTSQPKNENTHDASHTCFFCKRSGHVKKNCPKFAARRTKKGRLFIFLL